MAQLPLLLLPLLLPLVMQLQHQLHLKERHLSAVELALEVLEVVVVVAAVDLVVDILDLDMEDTLGVGVMDLGVTA